MTARLELTVLGGFRASIGPNARIALPTRKSQALLAYLAMPAGQAHPRDKVATLLWGDMQTPQARGSLRQALTALRKALGGTGALRLEGDGIALDPAAVAVDAQAFQALVADGSPRALEQAAHLYQGDLLAGLTLQEPPFEEWLLAERERLRETAMEALARLLAHHRAAGAPDAAVQAALKLLALDPLQEPVHRALMRLYVTLGRRSAALRQYQICVTALARELRAEPEAETKALYREILRERAAAPPEVEGGPPPPVAGAAPLRAANPIDAGETPLIGREAEMARLEQLMDRAFSGRGLLVGIEGEAGIGKSRLAAEISERTQARGGRVLVGRCYESERMLPFAPWVEALRGAGLERDRSALEELAPLWRAELARILPELVEPALPPAGASEATRTFEAVGQLLERLARRHPLLIVLEDVQWADETSIRLGAFLGRRVANLPVLIVGTGREEETRDVPLLRRTRDELARSGQVAGVRVRPLSREATLELARRLLPPGRAAREGQLAEQVWQMSEGNPFVAVEALRVLRDQPLGDEAAASALPARVRALIARRLERLGEAARRLVAVASVIGRQFDFRLLQAAAGLSEQEAAEGAEELVRHQILQQSGEGLEFVHQRIRDVARAQLLAPRRMLLHRAVADAIERLYAGDLDRHALALGLHSSEGQRWEQAAGFLNRAGLFAAARFAHRDAIRCYEQALAALGRLPASEAARRQAADLHFNLGRSQYAASAMDAAMESFRAARALAEAVGDARQSAEVSAGMTYLLASEGRYAEAIEAGERALATAAGLGDTGLEVWTAVGIARACHASGDYRRAIAMARRVLEQLADPAADRRFRPGALLPSVGARTWLALCLTRTGEFAQAQAAAEEAVAIAERVDGAQERAWAYFCLGHVHLGAGRFDRAVPVLERAAALCEDGAFPLYFPRILASLAAAHARPGRSERALELFDRAVAAAESRRVLFGHSLMLVLLATVRLLTGQAGEARRLAAQAVSLTRERGERGDLAWALFAAATAASQADPPDTAAALGDCLESLAIAEELGIGPLAARCHLALAALHERAGQAARAREAAGRAAALFSAMDMKYWLGRSEELIARLG